MPRLALSTLAAVVLLAGCDAASDGPPAPIAPAAFTAAAFPEANNLTGSAGPNFSNAAVRVGIVSTVVGLNLALPHAAATAATRATPTIDEAGVWTWAVTPDVLGTPVDVRLRAEGASNTIAWSLTTARAGDAPFLFTTATTSPDGRTGTWQLFNPGVAGPVLTAEFDVRSNPTATFRVPAGRDLGGSSVTYETAGRTQRFDWTAQPGNVRTRVEWNLDTGAGWIESPEVNGGARACWDARRANVACS